MKHLRDLLTYAYPALWNVGSHKITRLEKISNWKQIGGMYGNARGREE